ncbi:MAG: LamG domain-containing protein [Bacteroidales bacterium]|nr:LamG domain-containing protein [Bacteroidales bacterium]MBQ5582042.1 LamG domain-containing protein [Bacteroidales bacterium]
MKLRLFSLLVGLGFLVGQNAQAQKQIVWSAEYFPQITELCGNPQIIETALGPAVEFNGVDDGAFLADVPVKGMEEVTVEMIFKPYGNATFEQRFMHMGAYSGARIMFESRVNPDNTWYFDAFVHLGEKAKSKALIVPELTHPTDQWYNLTLVAGKSGIKSYVNGVLQAEDSLAYEPVINEGATSIGVRQNKVCWFKGAILKVRVTEGILEPKDFLQDHIILNKQ